VSATEWWDRQRAEADGAMAVQRQRHREMQRHPVAFVALLNRHPWITRTSIASLVIGEIAFGATAIALFSVLVLASMYLWRPLSGRHLG
jgi:hypothetical protein